MHFFRRTGEQLREATVTPKAAAPEQPPPPREFTQGTVRDADSHARVQRVRYDPNTRRK